MMSLKINVSIVAILLFLMAEIGADVIKKNVYLYESKAQAFRFSYEVLNLKQHQEQMGLMGIHYEFESLWIKPLIVNVGGYGAAVGDRGGFFTAGLGLGVQYQKKQYLVDGGVFLGGGGGASALPGNGDMIRPYMNIGIVKGDWVGLLGLSKNRISGEWLPSTWSLSMKRRWTYLKRVKALRIKKSRVKAMDKRNVYFSPLINTYIPDHNVRWRSQSSMNENIPLMGLEAGYQYTEKVTVKGVLQAAASSRADGYGKIAGGVSYQWPLKWIRIQCLIGMAGGGDIDTGGGALIWPTIELSPWIKSDRIKIEVGKIDALSGSFSATTLGIKYKFNEYYPIAKRGQTKTPVILSKKMGFSIKPALFNKTYWPKPGLRTKNNQNYEAQIQLIGVEALYKINDQITFSANTSWAYLGQVGAYAEGFFGLMIDKKIEKQIYYVKVNLGPAGGGGINVGSGLLLEGIVGIKSQLTKNIKGFLAVGKTTGLTKGSFSATTLQVGIEVE